MTFRLIFPLILLFPQSVLHGQGTDVLLRKGQEALAAGLWEMAALHFEERLAALPAGTAEKSHAGILLAEAWIRNGKAQEALDLLGGSLVGNHPEASFWKGQALIGLGRFTEAIDTLSPALQEPAALHRQEAVFTIANLEISLGHPERAMEVLSTLASSPDAALAAKARLRQVEILLDLGRADDARKTMPEPATVSPADQPLATYLDARLLLKEGRVEDAASSFRTLLDQPQGQSLAHHHAAALGLADALRARGTPDAATGFLLSFIQEHPDSPLLEAFFNRLLEALPEKPAATDPILEQLAGWITPSELPATGLLATQESTAAAAWPTPAVATNELLAFSLFSRALGLERVGTPESRAEAKRLFTRLRVENPDHFLANRSLFLMARRALDEGSIESAFRILDTLRETARPPTLRGQAAFLEARKAYQNGDKAQAIQLFEEAAGTLAESEAKTALLNAAIIRLTESSGTSTTVAQTDPAENEALTADLELERALSKPQAADVRAAIEEFLSRHPDHPRVSEARLAAAEAALAGTTPDISFARAQLDTLKAVAGTSPNQPSLRIAMIGLRIEDLAKDSNATIAMARNILEQHPGTPEANEAALILGRNLFQTRSYNDARLVLEKLAASDQDSARAQAAWLLAARAAALVPTSQSQQEALILFDKVIEKKASLAPIARLEKARLMVDMNRLVEASAALRKWFNTLPATDPLHLPAGLLLGEAIYAQGSSNPDSLTEALTVYDKLLVHAKDHPTVFNRLQYLRGRVLEQLPDEKDPSRKRDNQAFIAYYSVLETEGPPPEWHYFELCGFRALALLEKAARWPAAVACAKKIAAFQGPRAEEAATRASQLQLKHMIWED